jgi:hypothetical protein
MKSIFTAIFIIASLAIIYSCNSSSASAFTKSKSDTAQVVGVFEVGAAQGKQLRFDYMWRVIKDTFAVAKIDSTGDETTVKEKWLRDTIYFAPFLDTVRVNGVPQYDSTKVKPTNAQRAEDVKFEPKMAVVWIPFPKQLIYEVFEKKK